MKAKASGTGSGNPRGRGTYNPACDVCARKKTKCDGIKPVCQPCRQQGRQQECAWTKNPVRKPRTEQHFEALHKRAENLIVRVEEYRRYADYLESLLDQYQSDYHRHPTVDFRASRPSETDGLAASSSTDLLDHEFDFTVMSADDGEIVQEAEDPTKEICAPTQSLKIEEAGVIHHYGPTAPFTYEQLELHNQPSRFPALAENPDATYVLVVDAVDEQHCNPDFEWSRHLPSSVPLDRKSHDRALDLLFKFFTSWCFRIVPALFLRDMYRALSVPASQPAPKTPHYSPMLHNALVALALALLDEHRFKDLKTRQYFANTAKSFIEAECQKPNLSVVHALSILASFHSSQGEQTLGYLYFGMSARMSQALGLSVDCSEWVKLGLMDEPDRLDRHWANWTTFTQDVCWSLYVGRDFCVTAPSEAELGKDVSMPFVDQEYDQMPWVYGPSGLDPQPNYLTKTFSATCELLLISRRIMDVVNGLNRARRRPFAVDDLISEIDVKLNSWKGSLSPELEVTVKSRPTATPHKLMLHLAYWWLFILLHRPFFHRKVRPIYSTDREIDHVKLCRRAAENIMELLATWRSLYSLRYCPITLIQTVFSAGTVYLLTAMQAGSGMRIAQKELRHSLDQQKLVMTYLHEIGRSWQCATNIADILKGLMHEQLKPLLERKTVPITIHSGNLQIPEFSGQGEDDHEDGPTTLSRSSSKGHVRRHSSVTKNSKSRRLVHARNQSASQVSSEANPVSSSPAAASTSPTITISPVQQDFNPSSSSSSTSVSSASVSSSTSTSTVQTVSSPINIQSPPKPSASPFSSSPSSLPDPWGLRPNSVHNGSESPSSSPVFSNYAPSSFPCHSSSTSLTTFSHTHSSSSNLSTADNNNSNNNNALFSFENAQPIGHAFQGQGNLFVGPGQSSQSFSNGQALSSSSTTSTSSAPRQYPGKELAGFLGMLGGQTLPEAPFVGPFSFGDTTVGTFGGSMSMLHNYDASTSSSGFSPDPASLTPFGTGFLSQMFHQGGGNGGIGVDQEGVGAGSGSGGMVDNDTDMDDSFAWDMWAQSFES